MGERDGFAARFGVSAGRLELEVDLRLAAGWTSLFGPSGSGKTTILRVIAGLQRPDHARIAFTSGGREQIWCDTARGVCLPPQGRAVRIALQQAWLFPGTVRSNVAFGVAPARRKLGVDEVLDRFRLAPLASSDVRHLSGGERQRVSLARAAAAAVYGELPCSLLLLDEPFSGMDLALRDRFALELRDWLRERRMLVLSVTHDVGEAFLLGAEVARVAAGAIAAQGPADQVLAEERSRLHAVLGPET